MLTKLIIVVAGCAYASMVWYVMQGGGGGGGMHYTQALHYASVLECFFRARFWTQQIAGDTRVSDLSSQIATKNAQLSGLVQKLGATV